MERPELKELDSASKAIYPESRKRLWKEIMQLDKNNKEWEDGRKRG